MTAQLQQYSSFTQPLLVAFLRSLDALPRSAVAAARVGAQEAAFCRAEGTLLTSLATAADASTLVQKVWLLQAVGAAWKVCGDPRRVALEVTVSGAVLEVRCLGG